MMTKDL